MTYHVSRAQLHSPRLITLHSGSNCPNGRKVAAWEKVTKRELGERTFRYCPYCFG